MDKIILSVNYELGLLARNLKFINDQIKSIHNDVEKHYSEVWDELKGDSKNISDKIEGEFIDNKNDELISISLDIPKIYYSSFLIFCYSFIEQSFFKICDSYGVKISVGINDFDSKEKGIFKIKSFLKKANKCEFNNKDWNELCKFNKLRNYLVHNGNEIGVNYDDQYSDKYPKSKICGMDVNLDIKKDLYDYLKSNKLIESFGHCEIIIPTNEYCIMILQLTKRLLNDSILKLKQQ